MVPINEMKSKCRFAIILGVTLAIGNFFRVPYAFSEPIVFIANDSVPMDSITRKELKDIYTGKTKLWGNGDKIVLTFLKQTDVYAYFLRNYVNKTPTQFVNYWRNMVFMGKATFIPKSIKEEDKLMEYISSTKGAIGYISSNKLIKGIKVIAVK
ncbi:MAG: substrate-binding domain-containing protein [Proteobacteria bacterium]|nr:substrate-binding domain-containing protein [Pseudomonadota bacterium]